MIPPGDTTCFIGLSHRSLGLSPSPRGSVRREEALLHHSQCGLTDFLGTPCISVHERLPRAQSPEVQMEHARDVGSGTCLSGISGIG